MSYEISISPKYQITIPSVIRKSFPEIIPFNKVIFEVKDDLILIRPQKRLKDVVGILGKPPVTDKEKSIDQIRKAAYSKLRRM